MSADTLEAIGERHDLRAREISPLEDVGIFNAIYLVGSEYVLRIPRDAPPFVAAIRKESVAVPAARAAGVKTPALIAFDDSLDLLAVPYAIYERVHGETLGMLDFGPEDTPGSGTKWAATFFCAPGTTRSVLIRAQAGVK
jgi:aminoglycoside phosphotransferase (APT) family kinase protein